MRRRRFAGKSRHLANYLANLIPLAGNSRGRLIYRSLWTYRTCMSAGLSIWHASLCHYWSHL